MQTPTTPTGRRSGSERDHAARLLGRFELFRGLEPESPEIAGAVVRDLGRRLRELTGLVETDLATGDSERVAAPIAARAAGAGALSRGGVVELDRTQAELAEELGTTREGVARALSRLAGEGIIGREGRTIEIRDPAALDRTAGRT